MALSMTSNIEWDDIHIVKELKAGKVWLLTSITGEKLVIKVDANQSDQIKDANRIAKIIDPSAKMKVLSKLEVFALKRYIVYFNDLVAYFDSLNLTNHPLSHIDKSAIKNLKERVDELDKFPEPFVKMAAMDLLNLEDAAIQRSKGNKEMVKDFASTLKTQGGLEKLGQVVAADMFNDNTDRFYPNYNQQQKFGSYSIVLKACVNPGNVMLALNDNSGPKVTILDFADPNSKLKTFNTALNDDAKGFSTMVDKRLRKQFAKDIIFDLESILHPKKSKYSLKTKLGSNASSRIEKGMRDGMKLIKSSLAAKYPGGLPGKLSERVTKMI